MNNYFRLNTECYLVLGNKKSIIYNLLTSEMLWIDEKNTNKLIKAEKNDLIEVDKFYDELVEMGFGFYSKDPVFVDKLRTVNSFNQKKLWIDTQNINFATIQVTNECNLNCSFCQKIFCPSCKIFKENSVKKSFSVNELKKIIDDLIVFGTKSILFTGGETAKFKYIDLLLKYSIEKGINTNVHTNGLIRLNNVPKEVNILISIFDIRYVDKILKNYRKIKNVTLLVQEKDLKYVRRKIKHWKIIKTFNFDSERKITKKDLVKVDLSHFFTKKLSDFCLNGKIYISSTGDVYPCFESNISLLNIREESLSKAVKILITEYWKKPLEKIEKLKKCFGCEFRYACNTCRFVDVEKACTYDLEEGVWL